MNLRYEDAAGCRRKTHPLLRLLEFLHGPNQETFVIAEGGVGFSREFAVLGSVVVFHKGVHFGWPSK